MRKLLSGGMEPLPEPAVVPVEKAASYTIRGCKATSLSWACQLNVPEGNRGAQGHHRGAAARNSVRLYGRDDVSGALFCQKTILDKLHSGWRPHTAIGRGEQQPAAEPPCTIPTTSPAWDTAPVPTFKCPFTGLISNPQSVPASPDDDVAPLVCEEVPLGSDEDEDTEPEEDYIIPTCEDAAVHTPARSVGDF